MQGIFTNTENWSWTEKDELANTKLKQLLSKTRASLPQNFYTHKTMKHNDFIVKSQLFKVLKTIPKGVMHHNHYDCNEDLEFYKQIVVPEPNVYLSADLKTFQIGNKKQAEQGSWVSMKELKTKFESEDHFHKFLLKMTTFDTAEMQKYSGEKEAWAVFEVKISTFFPILFHLNIAKKYFGHVCRKYIRNGYDRIEFRFLLPQLNEYDTDGNLIKTHGPQKFKQIVDEAMIQLNKEFPDFSVGFISFGLKMFSKQQNLQILKKTCQLKWQKLIGIDFVNEQDPWGSLAPYNQLADQVLSQYPNNNLKKVYHAGESKHFLNDNVQIAVKAGSVRIGHGFNIIRKPYLTQIIKKKICFQVCPVSYLTVNYIDDPRLDSWQVLMNLGIPITINPDDPGKFNCQDATIDYLIALISSDWNLMNLKLIGIYSINHSICNQLIKQKIYINYINKWNIWINLYLNQKLI